MKRKGAYAPFIQAIRDCGRSDIAEKVEHSRAKGKEQEEATVASYAS